MNVISKDEILAATSAAFEEASKCEEGKNADYIPYLASVPSDKFGVSVVLNDGESISIGDYDFEFGIESISKVHTAILALKQEGAEEVLQKIGADATGLPFNSIMAILLENDHPSTPLVNSGAISAVSMIDPKGDSSLKWEAIYSNINRLCGSELHLIEELYKSESKTNFNNRSIAWLLMSYGRIYDNPEMSLDLYTRQCSLGVTAKQLAISAATIAFGGYNPVTKETVFPKNISEKIVSLMATVGFYEHTGDWMYESGVPAKSGVGGGVMGVVPGVMGVAAFSPKLDDSGNSVKAQTFIKELSKSLNLNVFCEERVAIEKK